jgi:hypothetical protein
MRVSKLPRFDTSIAAGSSQAKEKAAFDVSKVTPSRQQKKAEQGRQT